MFVSGFFMLPSASFQLNFVVSLFRRKVGTPILHRDLYDFNLADQKALQYKGATQGTMSKEQMLTS